MRRIKYFAGQHETKPIKDQRELDALYGYFLNHIRDAKTDCKRYQWERNYMLVHIGLNTAFRAEDLLQLRVVDVEKGYMSIKENKTGKMQNFRMNKQLHEDILEYINKYNLGKYDYLFRGQKPISIRLIVKWAIRLYQRRRKQSEFRIHLDYIRYARHLVINILRKVARLLR